jgi:hypothetical protein
MLLFAGNMDVGVRIPVIRGGGKNLGTKCGDSGMNGATKGIKTL